MMMKTMQVIIWCVQMVRRFLSYLVQKEHQLVYISMSDSYLFGRKRWLSLIETYISSVILDKIWWKSSHRLSVTTVLMNILTTACPRKSGPEKIPTNLALWNNALQTVLSFTYLIGTIYLSLVGMGLLNV